MKIAAYYRVSSEEQRQRQSIKSQQQQVQQYCSQALHSTLCQEYEDEAINGSIPLDQRPAGSRLLIDAKQGVFDTLLIWKLNRISRGGVFETLKTLKLLKGLGIRVISLHEQLDTATALGEMAVAMSAFAGRLEKESLRTNVISGQIRISREGKWAAGRAPFGYYVDDSGRLQIHEEQAKIVQEIFSLYLSGLGYNAIANRMNERGIPPPSQWLQKGKVYQGKKAKRWSITVVSNLLEKECYTGTHHYRKSETITEDGRRVKVLWRDPEDWITLSIPVIISKADFNRVKELRLLKLRRPVDGRIYILRGVIYCAQCGNALVGESKNSGGKRYFYYRCTGSIQRAGVERVCSNTYIQAEPLEQSIQDMIWRFAENPNEFIEAARARTASNASKAEELRSALEEVEKLLASVKEERARILRLISKGLTTEDEAEEILIDLKEREQRAAHHRDVLMDQASEVGPDEEAMETTAQLLALLRSRLLELESTDWQMLIPSFVHRIEVFAPVEGEPRKIVVDGWVKVEDLFRFDSALDILRPHKTQLLPIRFEVWIHQMV